MSPTKIDSFGSPSISSYSEPGKDAKVYKVTKDFIHKWTVDAFTTKMETMEPGEKIVSGDFHVGDKTKWKVEILPAGLALEGYRGSGWVSVFLRQKSKESVKVSWDWCAGRTDSGDFIIEDHDDEEWVDGNVKGFNMNGRGSPEFMEHKVINSGGILVCWNDLKFEVRIVLDRVPLQIKF